jgi:hypothetical protein
LSFRRVAVPRVGGCRVEIGDWVQAAEEAELARPAPGPGDLQRVAQHAIADQVEDGVHFRPESSGLGGQLVAR